MPHVTTTQLPPLMPDEPTKSGWHGLVVKKGVVHFVNSKNGKYFDETWHDYNNPHDIRIIREIRESEFDLVCDILTATKDLYFEMFGKKLIGFPYDKHVRDEI